MKDDQLKLFVTAIEKLYPRFILLCFQAQRHSWYFLNNLSFWLRLESINLNIITEERLDSEILLNYFDTKVPL